MTTPALLLAIILACTSGEFSFAAQITSEQPQATSFRASPKLFVTLGAFNIAATQLAELAQQRAVNAGVKAFAQQELDAHPENEVYLERLATERNAPLPTTIYAGDRALFDSLERLQGRRFDLAYMDDVIAEHERAIAVVEAALQSTQDASEVKYLTDTLAQWREHLARAQAAQKQL